MSSVVTKLALWHRMKWRIWHSPVCAFHACSVTYTCTVLIVLAIVHLHVHTMYCNNSLSKCPRISQQLILTSCRVTHIISSEGLIGEVSGVGYSGEGTIYCKHEVVQPNTHFPIRKVAEVSFSFSLFSIRFCLHFQYKFIPQSFYILAYVYAYACRLVAYATMHILITMASWTGSLLKALF